MKAGIIFFTILLAALKANAQSLGVSGRILYEQLSGGRVQYIEMWFSLSAYMYTTRNRPDDFLIKGKKYNSAEDSLKDGVENEKISLLMNEGQPSQIWYGDLGDHIVFNSVTLIDKQVITSDTLEFVKWDVKDDTVTINGILCQKAAGVSPKGAKLSAWFAPSIPLAVAPFTLRGLPGLLLEVKYDNNSVQTRTLQLDWPSKEKVTINFPAKESVVSKSEMMRMIEEHNEDAMQLLEYYKKQEKEKAKKNN
jgi:GLPGLI family protein